MHTEPQRLKTMPIAPAGPIAIYQPEVLAGREMRFH